MFNVQKQPVLVSGGSSLAQKPHLDARTYSHQSGRKSPWDMSTISNYPKQKGTHGNIVPNVLQSALPSSSSAVQVGTLPNNYR